ncbi:N-methyltransferase sirN, partial [Lachnellula suecica]
IGILYLDSKPSAHKYLRIILQHNLIKVFAPDGGIDTTIPKFGLVKIADIGTAGGLWLEELATALEKVPTKDGTTREFDGFDISDNFFPKTPPASFRFIKQNILTPFPKEFHGRYDFIHLRLLLAALKKEQIPTAVQNVIQLLAPGGYIQWDEWDATANSFVPENEAIQSAWHDNMAFLDRSGFAVDIPVYIKRAFQDQGLNNVMSAQYKSMKDAETAARSRPLIKLWTRSAWNVMMPFIHARTDDGKERSSEEAKRIVDEKLRELENYLEGGGQQSIGMIATIGQKGITN